MKKKLITLLITLTATLCLAGCTSGLQDFADTTLPELVKDRGEVNKNWAENFRAIGVISDEQCENMKKNIDVQVKKYTTATDANGSIGADTLATIANSVSQYTLGGEGNPSYVVLLEGDDNDKPRNLPYVSSEKGYMYVKSDGSYDTSKSVPDSTVATMDKDGLVLPNFIMSNYLHVYQFSQVNTGDIGVPVTRDENKITPIEFISKDVKDAINDLTKAEVYVLRPDITTVTGESTLDGIMAKVQDAVNTDDKNNQQRLLANYFYKAEDINGNPITLVDKDDESYDLITTSKPNNDPNINIPGYDLIVGQYDMVDCIHIRFTEFNSDAYDKLNKLLGQETCRMYLVPDEKGAWKAYLMEYPIHVINELSHDSYDKVSVEFAESGLGVNLMTGKFIKYGVDSAGNWDQSQTTTITASEPYLTLTPAENNDQKGITSLVLKGVTTTTVEDTSGTKHELYCGRIVLRDYLEATFAPEFEESNENVAVFGRKIRFDMQDTYWEEGEKFGKSSYKQLNLYYNKTDSIAYFVDKDGNEIVTSPKLNITDFCDIKSLCKNSYKLCVVKSITTNEIQATSVDATIKDGEIPKISNLRRIYTDTDSIKPTDVFPGKNIGNGDYKTDNETKQRFYCIATTKGLFDSALFSDWINSTSTTASLEWWNQYLLENGFSYQLSHEAVNDYISSNYKYELSQNGVIILDLETVAKIQEQFDDDSNKEKVSGIRTFFMILGYILMGYSIMLMLCWVIDTNADVGVKLLEKVTFGNWIGVKYEEDIPYRNINDRTYLTAGKMFTRCIILIVLGLILIKVNIFRIVLSLVELFGPFASQIERIVKGFR